MLQTKLKSGYVWGYSEDLKELSIFDKEGRIVFIPRSKIRSLGCYINRVAWHRERKHK